MRELALDKIVLLIYYYRCIVANDCGYLLVECIIDHDMPIL